MTPWIRTGRPTPVRILLACAAASLALLSAGSPVHAGGFLFDTSHYEQAGNADWVVDADQHNFNGSDSNAQQVLTPAVSGVTASTPETYWTGALSSWGVALAKRSYGIEQVPTSLTSNASPLASSTISLAKYKVLVVVEPNSLFSAAEKTAIVNFVAAGGGLFLVSDHAVSDRNNDGIDSVDVWNDLFTNNGVTNNPFGMAVNANNISQTSSNSDPTAPFATGSGGTATSIKYSNGATFTISPTANASVKGAVWTTGTKTNSNVMMAYATYGLGRVVALGDSSAPDDGTGDPNDTLFTGWAEASHAAWITNASDWLFASAESRLVATTTNTTWSTAAAWAGAVPNVAGYVVDLNNPSNVSMTLTLDSARTVGSLRFTGPTVATLAGSATLTLQAAVGGTSDIRVSGIPNLSIGVPIKLASATTIDVASGNTLAIPNLLTTTQAVTKTGVGSLTLNQVNLGALHVQAGTVRLDNTTAGQTGAAQVSSVTAIDIASASTVTLGGDANTLPCGLIVDYAGTSPLATIKDYAATNKIRSGAPTFVIGYGEASTLGVTNFLGAAVDGTAVLLLTTYAGDATLDSKVDFSDLLTLAKNYGQPGEWTAGDSNYDGTVDFSDLLLLAKNYGQSNAPAAAMALLDGSFVADWSLAQSLVPEPVTIGALALLFPLARRRRAR